MPRIRPRLSSTRGQIIVEITIPGGALKLRIRRIRDKRWTNYKTDQHMFEVTFLKRKGGEKKRILLIDIRTLIEKVCKMLSCNFGVV